MHTIILAAALALLCSLSADAQMLQAIVNAQTAGGPPPPLGGFVCSPLFVDTATITVDLATTGVILCSP